MMYCPLMSFAKQYANEQECLGKECAFAGDVAGKCLVQQALQCYVNKERNRKDVQQFLTEGSIKPAFPHGGVYEDMTPSYDNLPF